MNLPKHQTVILIVRIQRSAQRMAHAMWPVNRHYVGHDVAAWIMALLQGECEAGESKSAGRGLQMGGTVGLVAAFAEDLINRCAPPTLLVSDKSNPQRS